MNDLPLTAQAARSPVPVSVEGPHGPIRLKWHKLRTLIPEAPFKPRNLVLGWGLGASLEVDIVATADDRFVVIHDTTFAPSTNGCGRVHRMALAATTGLFHRDGSGTADPEAPLLSLADLVAPLRTQRPGPGANLQLDLKLAEGQALAQAALDDAAAAVAGLEHAIIVGSHYLDQARRLAEAIPGARLGYDPMRAASRDPGLARDPSRMLRHIERRRHGLAVAYLRFDLLVELERRGFPLASRLLELGIETDAWTVNPGPGLSDAALRALVNTGVRQITTDSPIEMAGLIATVLPE